MRITQGMMYARALADVQSGLFRYSQLQQDLATGRRINRPSDDPSGALRILPLRSDLRNLEQMGDNVALARETLNTGASSLEDASSLMQRIRELTTQASNGTLNSNDRQGLASEVDQLLGQLVSIGNSRRGDRYLFGGTENVTTPFQLVDGDGGTRVLYRGNRDRLEIEVAPGVTTALNVPGDAIFQARNRGATVFTPAFGGEATGAAPAGNGDTGIGFGGLTVSFAGLGTDAPSSVSAGSGTSTAVGPLSFEFTTGPDSLSIGGGTKVAIPVTNGAFTTGDGRTISLTVTGLPTGPMTGTMTARASLSVDGGATSIQVSDFTSSSVQVANSHDGTVLNVDVRNLARTGAEDVKFEGTFDAFTTLISLRDLLRNEDGLPDEAVRDRVAQMLPEVDRAHDAVLDGVRELGFRSSTMDVLSNRVENLRASRTEALSLVQDTDIADAILELQQQDLAYQAALQVSARVMQTTLQGFLR
jgi:flagellar hook-associated protein 3